MPAIKFEIWKSGMKSGDFETSYGAVTLSDPSTNMELISFANEAPIINPRSKWSRNGYTINFDVSVTVKILLHGFWWQTCTVWLKYSWLEYQKDRARLKYVVGLNGTR